MRMGRSEAVDLFRKWSVDGAVVRCRGTFSRFAFGLDGRISISPDGTEVRVVSDDRRSEIVVRLSEELEFGYADSREVTGSEKEYEACVVIFTNPPVPQVGTPDTIAIAVQDESLRRLH